MAHWSMAYLFRTSPALNLVQEESPWQVGRVEDLHEIETHNHPGPHRDAQCLQTTEVDEDRVSKGGNLQQQRGYLEQDTPPVLPTLHEGIGATVEVE
eukprot:3915266-Amphidinium_carterae.1